MNRDRVMVWLRTSYLVWPLAIGVVFGLLGWFTNRPVFAFILWATQSAISVLHRRASNRSAASDSRFVSEMRARQASSRKDRR